MIRPRGYLTADPIETERGTHWRDEAACLEVGPELFYAAPSDKQAIAYAKSICKGDEEKGWPPCPVASQCLQEAMETKQEGVWGGTTDYDRRLMRRRASAKARKSA